MHDNIEDVHWAAGLQRGLLKQFEFMLAPLLLAVSDQPLLEGFCNTLEASKPNGLVNTSLGLARWCMSERLA